MKSLESIERYLAKINAKLPKLPADFRDVLVENVWWLVLVNAIIDTVILLVSLPNISFLFNQASISNIYIAGPSANVKTAALIGAVVAGVSIFLMYTAVKPLQSRRVLGWRLTFAAQVLKAAWSVVSFLLLITLFPLLSLIMSLIYAALWLYVLFQVRSDFTTREARAREADVVEIVKSKTVPRKKPTPRKTAKK